MNTPATAGLSLQALVGRGRCAEVFGVEGGRVVKLFHPDIPAADVAREYERTLAASEVCALALRPVGLVEHTGRNGILLPRVEGESLLASLMREPWRGRGVARRLASLHAQIHACRADSLPPLREMLAAQITRADLPASQRRGVLDRLAICPDGDRLCHMDFHPDQILATAEGDVVVDWITACRGDPAADIARTQLLLSVGHPPDTGPARRLLIDLMRHFVLRAYLQRSAALRGAGFAAALAQWRLPLMAARLAENVPEQKDWLRKRIAVGLR